MEWFDALEVLSDWDRWPDFVLNASTELLGIVVTVLVVTPLVGAAVQRAQRRRQSDRERRLISMLRSRHKAIAATASVYPKLIQEIRAFLTVEPLGLAIDRAIIERDGPSRITGHDAEGRERLTYKGRREVIEIVGTLSKAQRSNLEEELMDLANRATYALSDGAKSHAEFVRLIEQVETSVSLMNVDLSYKLVEQVASYFDKLRAIDMDWSSARHIANHLLRLLDEEEIDFAAIHADAATREDTFPDRINTLIDGPTHVLEHVRLRA